MLKDKVSSKDTSPTKSPKKTSRSSATNPLVRQFQHSSAKLAEQTTHARNLFSDWKTRPEQVSKEHYDNLLLLLGKESSRITQGDKKAKVSLIGSVNSIVSQLQNANELLIRQHSPRSELFQLLLGLTFASLHGKLEHFKSIVLVTRKPLLPHYEHFVIRQEQEPSLEGAYLRDLLTTIFPMVYYEEPTNFKAFSSHTLFLFDTFMTGEDIYLPLYLHIKAHYPESKFVMYTDDARTPSANKSVVEIGQGFPVEIVKDADNWKNIICEAIKNAKLYAEKTDVVIIADDAKIIEGLKEVLNAATVGYKVLTGSEPQDDTISNIIVALDEEELACYNYSYDNVSIVFDLGWKHVLTFSSLHRCYVQAIRLISPLELQRRSSFLGRLKPGRYLRGYSKRCHHVDSFASLDLSRFITHMLYFGFKLADITRSRSEEAVKNINNCIELLVGMNILQKNDGEIKIVNNEVLKYPLRPFLVSLFIEHSKDEVLINQLSYLIGLLETKGVLHLDSARKMDNIWLKGGDMSSCVQILSILDRIIANKGPLQVPTIEKAPSMTEGELDMFGILFEDIKPKQKLTISEMTQSEFFEELSVNRKVAKKSLFKAQKIREMFGVKRAQVESTQEQVDKLSHLLFENLKSFGVYTGSRRFGYHVSPGNQNLLPAESSLLVRLNSRPSLILPLKLLSREPEPTRLLMSNRLGEAVFVEVNGELPIMTNKSSFGDTELEFNGIATALFEMLFKDGLVESFEKKYNCMVEPNQEISSLLIFCERGKKDTIEKEFNTIIENLRKELLCETKILDLNNLKLLCQRGGSVKEIMKSAVDKTLLLTNLPANCTKEQLAELIEDCAPVAKIELQDDKNGKKAIITFESKSDLYDVYNQLNYMEFDGRRLRFEQPTKPDDKNMVAQSCLKFWWYVWKGGRKGTIRYKTAEAAHKALQVFTKGEFDGKHVKADIKHHTIHLDNLNELTDEIYLRNALQVFGDVEEIHLEKAPLNEKSNYENLIDFYIKQFTTKNERFHIQSIKKKQQGLRVAKVRMQNAASIPVVCSALNDKKGLIGQTRLYVTPYYSHPLLMTKSMEKLVEDFEEDIFRDNPMLKPKIQSKYIDVANKRYKIIESTNQDAFNLFVKLLTAKLKESPMHLAPEEKAAILCEQGMARLAPIQQKYMCKFVPNFIKKDLGVICRDKVYTAILAQLKNIPLEVEIMKVSVSASISRQLAKNLKRLDEIKEKYVLDSVSLDSIGKVIVMVGKSLRLQTAKNNINHFLQSIAKDPENEFGAECCEICCEELNHPYRLQSCGHVFCLECLMISVNNSFADASTFPIKCPNCLEHIVIRDLTNILDETAWGKLRNIAINDYVNKNSENYMFCYTANCQGIHSPKVAHFSCDVCRLSYCAKCKLEMHKGLTCEEAKEGSMALLQKFMEAEDVRICPNVTCKMLIQRIDGCYRVTCSKCQQSICWKCPRDSMPIYKTAEECYKHLTEKHGGYW